MESRLTRRGFLGVTGAVAGAALTPRAAQAIGGRTQEAEPIESDVIVVGAGLAGLAAAQAVRAAGLAVSVLEARDRVGGRAHDVRSSGALLPLGAIGVHGAQERLLALASGVGVGVASAPSGVSALPVDGEVRRTLERLERMSHEVDAESPWAAAGARFRDGRTLQSWISETVSDGESRDAMIGLARAVWGSDPADISLLHAVATVAAAGGSEPLVVSALAPRSVAGGVQRMAERVGSALGSALRLSSPVRKIDQDDDGVVVTADSAVVRARRAVVALPPALTTSISWTPDLPAARRQLAQRLPLGAAATVACSYLGLGRPNGEDVVGVDVGPFSVVRNASQPAGSTVLVGTAVGDSATAWSGLPPRDRRESALSALADRFGRWAGRPAEYTEFDWQADPYAGGGWGVPMPGAIASLGPMMREPFGHVHWAGAETASRWTGTLEGAVVSGERAAGEILASLGRRVPTALTV